MGLFGKKSQGSGSQGFNLRTHGGAWIREIEHIALRVVSLGFSLGSAHAIRWFFSPLDSVDVLQPFITWIIAIGFGVLGYFLSRGLAHRLMNKEQVWAYLPICIAVEFVEIFCNFALAASVISHATWLDAVPEGQRNILIFMTYIALSIIPLVSVLLAVVDMDLARGKHVSSSAQPKQASSAGSAWGQQPQATYPQGYTGGGAGANGGNNSKGYAGGGASGNGANGWNSTMKARANGNAPLAGVGAQTAVIP